MTVLLKNNSVFFHIPKTGGWWVLAVLQHLDLVRSELGSRHADYERVLWHDRFYKDAKVLRGILRRAVSARRAPVRIDPQCFKFCFVREPLKWYESYWRFMQSLDWVAWGDELKPNRWHPLSPLNGLGSADFNTFMDNVNRKRPGFVTELYGRYARADVVVGKQETLLEDTLRIFRQMEVGGDDRIIAAIPKVNETCPASFPPPAWDRKVKQEMLRLEYAGYVRYGYSAEAASLTAA